MKLLLGILVATVIVIGVFLFVDTKATLALDEHGCLSCHSNPDLVKTDKSGRKISLHVSESAVNTAAHRYIDCTTCHTTEPHKTETPLTKLSLAEKCGSCHRYEYQLHLESTHGRQLALGNPDVATCVDCHSPEGNPHSVIRVLEYNSPAYKKNIADTCARCHGDAALMADYGIVEKVYESYMRSFHGKAIELGTYELTQLDTATCTNCHGTHDIKSTDDPSSPVAGVENLAKTCEKCHPGAGVSFAAGFLGHKEASPQNIPAAHNTEILFTTLLITVLSFGGIVVIAAIVRFSLNRWKE